MGISLMHFAGAVPEEDIADIGQRFAAHGIAFRSFDATGKPQNCVLDIVAPFAITVSADVVTGYFLGVAANATYDLIRSTTLRVWNHLAGKAMSRITSRGVVTEHPADLDLILELDGMSSLRLKLRSNQPSALQEKCLDKAFALVRETVLSRVRDVQGEHIVFLDSDSDEWSMCSDIEFIDRVSETQERKKRKSAARSGA